MIYLARILNIKITAATRTKKNGNFPELKTQQEQQIVVGMYKKSLAPTTIVLSPFQRLFFLISNFVEWNIVGKSFSFQSCHEFSIFNRRLFISICSSEEKILKFSFVTLDWSNAWGPLERKKWGSLSALVITCCVFENVKSKPSYEDQRQTAFTESKVVLLTCLMG